MPPRSCVLHHPGGETVRVESFPAVLGAGGRGTQAPDVDLAKFDEGVGMSRRHAVLDWDHDRLTVTDLGSTNGTRVDGDLLEPRVPRALGPRSEVALAGVPFLVVTEGPARVPTLDLPPTVVDKVWVPPGVAPAVVPSRPAPGAAASSASPLLPGPAPSPPPGPPPPPAAPLPEEPLAPRPPAAPPAPAPISALPPPSPEVPSPVPVAPPSPPAAPPSSRQPALELGRTFAGTAEELPGPWRAAGTPSPEAQRGVDEVVSAVRDPTVSAIAVEVGVPPRVRRHQGWSAMATAPATASAFGAVWELLGTESGLGGHSAGYASALLGQAAVVEVAFPPLVRRPWLHLEKRLPVLSLDDLVSTGRAHPGHVEALRGAILAGSGVLVVGGPRSGRTALLEALAGALSPAWRVVALEARAGLRLGSGDAISLVAPPGPGSSVLDVALSLLPDCLVVDDAAPSLIVAMIGRGAMPPALVSVRVPSVDRLELALGGAASITAPGPFGCTVCVVADPAVGFRLSEIR